jgi:hypothetical protein
MKIRRFQPGEELALFEIYYSAIHSDRKNRLLRSTIL